MASHHTRNPKDLRDIVNASSKDLVNMQDNLSKLKALSEDDKTENAKLRSRIDEQCQLIMILKQRADEEIIRNQTLEKINKELSDFRDQADGMLKIEIRKTNLLDQRFNNLASNHEEMIRIKDEYKRVNQELKEENRRLKNENAQLFSKTIVEKDNIIQAMETKCVTLNEKCHGLEQKLRVIQVESRQKEDLLRKEVLELQTTNAEQVKTFQRQLQNTEERLKSAEYKLQTQLDAKNNITVENSAKLQQMTKEKDELLALVMQRGKIVQKEQDTNKVLQKKIDEMEKAVKNMEEKFRREAEAVNANLKVRRLTEDLNDAGDDKQKLTQEFEAFKKHSGTLLKKERELNERLRHLCG